MENIKITLNTFSDYISLVLAIFIFIQGFRMTDKDLHKLINKIKNKKGKKL